MAEKDVNLNIKTEADTSGVTQTENAVKQLKQTGKSAETSLKGVSQQSGQAAEALAAFGGAVGIVNPQMGASISLAGRLTNGIKGLGNALKALFTTPIGIALAAITAAFVSWRIAMNKVRGEWESLRESMDRMRNNSIESTNRRIAKSFEDVSRAVEDTTDKLAHLRELEDMRTENARSMADAQRETRKQRELADAPTAEERADIEEKYNREQVEADLQNQRADIQKRANEAYSDTDKANYEKTRKQLQEAEAATNGLIKHLELDLKEERKIATGATKTGLSFWGSLTDGYGLTTDAGRVVDETDKKEAERKSDEIKKQLETARAELTKIKNDQAKNDREEAQAIEKRDVTLEGLSVAEEQAEARRAALDAEHNARYFAQEAKKPQVERYYESVPGLKANDRISQMGGFATAGAKAASGISVLTVGERQLKEAQKQSQALENQALVLEKIETNTAKKASARFA